MSVVLAKCLEAKTRCFFTICNNLTALTTRLHLEMWQLWCNDDDDNDDDKTDYFTPCACTWDNKYTLAQSLHRKLMPSSPQLHHETYLLTCRINTEARTPGIFGHFILEQAQATRGGAIPSGTLESPLSISRAKALASTSTLHQDTKNSGFGNSYVQMCVFIFVQCMPMPPCMTDFFPIGDSGSFTHKLIESRPPSATVVFADAGQLELV